jgi:hypothetical protein
MATVKMMPTDIQVIVTLHDSSMGNIRCETIIINKEKSFYRSIQNITERVKSIRLSLINYTENMLNFTARQRASELVTLNIERHEFS